MFKNIIKFIKGICLFIGAITLCSLLIGGYLNAKKMYGEKIEKGTYLKINFADDFSEIPSDDLLASITGTQTLELRKLIDSINYAARDDSISGIIANINVSNLEFAQIQEIARAIQRFRIEGKKAYAYSQSFGPLGGGNKEYYLATYFDKIYMQPHSTIGLTGISIEVPFLKDALEKIGVSAEFYARHEYKNAAASFTDSQISPAYKKELEKLTDSLFAELRLGITQNRKLNDKFINIVNKAPLMAEEGVKLNLIDGIMYQADLFKQLKTEGAKKFVDITKYASMLVPNSGDLPTLAVLNLSGEITDLAEGSDLSAKDTINSRKVIADLKKIAEIENLKGVVVRINSPGGSYTASDEIYYALKKFKQEKNIPLIVSQSGYAASGGYFISLAGDKIFADEATITGSIGVVGGKPVFQGLWNKLGINWASVNKGKNANILSVNHRFSDNERKIFNASLDAIYADFTAKVLENRPQIKNIDKVARGRVWLGRDAQKIGLVDELGGLEEALLYTVGSAKIDKDSNIIVETYPKNGSFSERLSNLLLNGEEAIDAKIARYGVNIEQLKLFKRLQYDSVLQPMSINM